MSSLSDILTRIKDRSIRSWMEWFLTTWFGSDPKQGAAPLAQKDGTIKAGWVPNLAQYLRVDGSNAMQGLLSWAHGLGARTHAQGPDDEPWVFEVQHYLNFFDTAIGAIAAQFGGGESAKFTDAIVVGDWATKGVSIDGNTGISAPRTVTFLDKTYTIEETGHHAKHQHGGSDEVATATAAANAIPKADGTGKLDKGWLPTVTIRTDQDATAGANKYDFSGATNVRIPHVSADPSTLVNGDIWIRSDLHELRVRESGVTHVILFDS